MDLALTQQAAAMIEQAQKIVVLTGAGISTESNIPDFRGPQGVWTKNPAAEKRSTIENYMNEPETRISAWRDRLNSPIWDAVPNQGHKAIVKLEQANKLELLVTQNIDGLHQKAGTSPDKIVEIHGTAREVVCMACPYRVPAEIVLERVRLGETDPACPDCGYILKSATISFGQQLVSEDLARSQTAAQNCDLAMAIGSSLSVYPAAAIIPEAKRCGAEVLIINGEPTEMDLLADLVIHAPTGQTLSELIP